MIIEIDFLNIKRSEVREAVLAVFDLLNKKEEGVIFRDDYGMVCKDNPGQIVLEVLDDLDEDTKCFVWQDGRWSLPKIKRRERYYTVSSINKPGHNWNVYDRQVKHCKNVTGHACISCDLTYSEAWSMIERLCTGGVY